MVIVKPNDVIAIIVILYVALGILLSVCLRRLCIQHLPTPKSDLEYSTTSYPTEPGDLPPRPPSPPTPPGGGSETDTGPGGVDFQPTPERFDTRSTQGDIDDRPPWFSTRWGTASKPTQSEGGVNVRPSDRRVRGGSNIGTDRGGANARSAASRHETVQEVGAGGVNARPQSGGVNARPQSGGVNARPQSGGVNARPQSGGVNVRPQSGGVNVRPQSGGVNVRP